jgi:aspartyl protease family protein
MCGAVLLLGFLAAPALSQPAASDAPSADDVLKSKGLHKLNQYFALAGEVDMSRQFRELEPLGKKAADAQQRAAAAAKKVEDKKQLILNYLQKRRELRAQLANARTVEMNNNIVSMLNELGDRIALLQESDQEEKDAKAARAAASQLSEQYVELLLKARKQYDGIGEKYDQLAADPDVQKAIEDFNKDSPKTMKLGPSGAFALLDRNLKKLESKVVTESIALRAGDGNLWHVVATLNGKLAQDFAIDTGASIISLPHKVAEKAGMTPSPSDPTVTLTLADGHVVEGKRVYASSVRLGKFTVEHVACAVMPADLPDAEPLLGLSFFEHFTYKIDSAKGRLTMAQIEAAADKGPRRPAGRPEPRGKRAAGE